MEKLKPFSIERLRLCPPSNNFRLTEYSCGATACLSQSLRPVDGTSTDNATRRSDSRIIINYSNGDKERPYNKKTFCNSYLTKPAASLLSNGNR